MPTKRKIDSLDSSPVKRACISSARQYSATGVIDLTLDNTDNEVQASSSKLEGYGNSFGEPMDVDDPELDAIMSLIKEQEASERLARQLQDAGTDGSRYSSQSSNFDHVIDVDTDEQLAYSLDAQRTEEIGKGKGKASLSRKVIIDLSELDLDELEQSSSRPRRYQDNLDDVVQSPDEKLAAFRELFVGSRPCSKCGSQIDSPRGNVVLKDANIPPSLAAVLHARCPSCYTNHCRGCFKVLCCRSTCKGSTKKTVCEAASCCAEVRVIALFEILSSFDNNYIAEREEAHLRALETSASNRAAVHSSVGPGGTGYGMDDRGRGRGHGNPRRNVASTSKKAEKILTQSDVQAVRALELMTTFLPRPYADDAQTYDLLPHASLGLLLSLSCLPQLLGDLLRNDSVTDWTNRNQIYYAMISLLRRMADCELTIQVLIEPRCEAKTSCGIQKWMWEENSIKYVKDQGRVAMQPPLFDYFKKLTRQCESFMTGVSQMMEVGEADDETVQATSLCGDLITARDSMERAILVIGRLNSEGKGKGKGKDPSIDLERRYSKACEHLAFKHITFHDFISLSRHQDEDTLLPVYHYAKELAASEKSTRNPKDRLHLVKELAVMATSLPPGIWVRVDEVRNDAIKILIAGPENTPYEGGLFEFDCWIPLEYPHGPPLMNLSTTGGGTVRFNPNLYNQGKVCLSLLGTWSGRADERWTTKSTLLQVLVSIQSMILVEYPYFNEPGHGQVDPNNPQSKEYNRNIRVQTVRWAMIEWLQDKHKNGIWGDVIASHFTIRKDKIRETLHKWATADSKLKMFVNYERWGGSYAPLALTPHRPVPAPAEKTRNLLEEFDAGVRLIQRWKVDYGQEL